MKMNDHLNISQTTACCMQADPEAGTMDRLYTHKPTNPNRERGKKVTRLGQKGGGRGKLGGHGGKVAGMR